MTMTFTDVFKARIDKMETDARLAGLNLTTICKEAGISRATPDRWKKRPPKTVEIVTQMEAIVAQHVAGIAAVQ